MAAGAGARTGPGCRPGQTGGWLMEKPEGCGAQEGLYYRPDDKTFCADPVQTALACHRGRRGPSGECPPHCGDRAPCVWDFLPDDFPRLSRAGPLTRLEAWLAEAVHSSRAGPGIAGQGGPAWARHGEGAGGREEKDLPVELGVCTPWELLELFELQHQG